MNISNKILIGFFGTAFVYMTAVFVEIRFTGKNEDLTNINTKTETAPLDNVNYLIVDDPGSRLYIKSSKEPRLELRSGSGDFLSKVEYEIKGDTLIIGQLNLEDEAHFDLTLFIPENFIGIEAKETSLHLSEIYQPNLSINQEGGRTVLNNDIKLWKLSITGSLSAELDVFNSDIDTLTLDIDDSSVEMRTYVSRVEGSVRNDSYLYVENVDDLDFKKDRSSTIRF